MPHISDIPGKQRIGLPPVGAVVVEHLALRELAGTDPGPGIAARRQAAIKAGRGDFNAAAS